MTMADLIGQTLGQYRIEAPLDAGGMGQVFRGVHTYLNRPAAIKVMRPQLAAQPRFRERFLQEARSAAALQHEHIVSIYEFGEERGQLYLVMELMTAGSLRSLLHRRTTGQPWPLSLGIDLVRQAAEGLAAAQAQSILHRDIKPDNLLLNRLPAGDTDNERYRLKISDFGLARLAEGSGLTGTGGGAMGTLAYMSPEQCQGKPLDGRSDLYSLGVVLYEVATGSLPFQIGNFNEAVYKHNQLDPTSPRQIQPDLPQALEDVILRSLAKKPEDRFQNGAELARALQRISDTMDSAIMPPISIPSGELPTMAGRTQPQQALGNTPPPSIMNLSGGSGLPRIRVLDKQGQTLTVVAISSHGITVGRQEGLDLVLLGPEVSRQHLHIRWDGTQILVKDLGSSNGTLLQGVKLQPQVSQPWLAEQMLRIGPYWLRLEGTEAFTDRTMQHNWSSNRTGSAAAVIVSAAAQMHEETLSPPSSGTTRTSPDLKGVSTLAETPFPPVRTTQVEPGRTRKPRRILPVAFIVLVGLLLIAGGSLFFLLSPPPPVPPASSATVTITPDSQNLQQTFTISAVTGSPDQTQQQVQARLVSITTQGQSQTVNATGKGTTPATQAKGSLTFHAVDTFGSSKGTTFQTTSGLTVVQDEDVTIGCTCGGTQTVAAHVSEAGAAGNIPPNAVLTSIRSPGGNVTVSNDTSFTGGQDAQSYTFIQQSDIDGAANTLKANAPDATQTVQGNLHTGEHQVGTPSCAANAPTADHAANDRASTVTVTRTFTCTGEAYDYDGALAMAAQKLKDQAASNPGASYTLSGKVSTTFQRATIVDGQGTVNISVAAQGTWTFQLSEAQKHTWLTQLVGKKKSAAHTFLQAQKGVKQVDIQLPNGDHNTFPTDSNAIQIVLHPVAA